MAIEAEALRALSEKATQGTWSAHHRYIGTTNHMSSVGEVRDQNGNWSDTAKSTGDAAFIVALVNAYRSGSLIHRSALAEDTARAAEGWQPIETAPKDGTDVLLFDARRPPVVAGWFDEPETDVPGWYDFDDPERPLYFIPTHWMPLPALRVPPLTEEAGHVER